MKQLNILVFFLFFLSACSGGNTFNAVTPIPDKLTSATSISPTPTLPAPIPSATTAAANAAFPTPAPQFKNLPPGESREIARATDIALIPNIENRIQFDAEPVSLRFDEFYSGFDMRRGLQLTEKLLSLDGKTVSMEGYIAPPLKPRIDFFVLTKIPLAFCPFCSTDASWPDDIALVYLPEQAIYTNEYPVRVIGQLEVGTSVDADSGMVSLVRIYAESIENLQ